ncbi:winged helix DNA-binding domain-containing protein [Asanoa sp. WMMD1127]|uniref:winged helix DNA-binding domain-containing protein n=1 Tax=Asanoa sp. WMMD1127 TaxID=3016107 RepID=UPI0024177622|nr:winged helix DNA-binding domain-containing protein [Asanoa sp. WMMD1127]MDG4824228.1 winged helix DNA-binding domain-containing protein [Asanoa sp. WMMD1127]
MRTPQDTATTAGLNRALLARQGLLDRHKGPGGTRHSGKPLVSAIEQIGALQAQQWSSPPVGLWSRLSDFAADDLWAVLDKGDVVTGILMRRTLHLVSAAEHPVWARIAAETGVGGWLLRGVETPERAQEMLEATIAYADQARTGDELTAFAEQWVEQHPDVLPAKAVAAQREYKWRPFRAQPAFVKVPANGSWGAKTPAAYHAGPPTPARLTSEKAWETAVSRHLGAFGPAGADDIAYWLGAAAGPVKAALERLDLVTLGETGGRRVLWDLPDAPRPADDTDAPPRFLPAFDNALLAYAANRRARILPDAYKDRVYLRRNLRWLPTLLVDGLVAGVWSTETKRGVATLTVTAFEKLTKAAAAAVEAEGEQLIRFTEPTAKDHVVRISTS